MNETITIPMDRFLELIRKEVGFDYRREELIKDRKWVNTADRIIFDIPEADE